MGEGAAEGHESSVAYILLHRAELPELGALDVALERFKVEDVTWSEPASGEQLNGQVDGVFELALVLVAIPPRLTLSTVAPTSPDKAAMDTVNSHYVLSLKSQGLKREAHDRLMAAIMAAFLEAGPTVGALMAHCGAIHRPEVFTTYIPLLAEGQLAIPGVIDFTMAKASESHLAFLSYGLERYACDNLLITVPKAFGQQAYEFALDMAAWLPKCESPPEDGQVIQLGPYPALPVQTKPDPRFPGRQLLVIELGVPPEESLN